MKIISNRPLVLDSMELNPMSIEPTPVKLWASLTLLESQAAQLIVCDASNSLQNMVCIMNLSGDPKGECVCT